MPPVGYAPMRRYNATVRLVEVDDQWQPVERWPWGDASPDPIPLTRCAECDRPASKLNSRRLCQLCVDTRARGKAEPRSKWSRPGLNALVATTAEPATPATGVKRPQTKESPPLPQNCSIADWLWAQGKREAHVYAQNWQDGIGSTSDWVAFRVIGRRVERLTTLGPFDPSSPTPAVLELVSELLAAEGLSYEFGGEAAA